jgi:hypothetical protein
MISIDYICYLEKTIELYRCDEHRMQRYDWWMDLMAKAIVKIDLSGGFL